VDLMIKFGELVDVVTQVEAKIGEREAQMASRELKYVRSDARDVRNPDEVGGGVMAALDKISKRLDKLEGRRAPAVDDEDDDEATRYFNETVNAAGKPKGDDMRGDEGEEDGKPKPPMAVPGVEEGRAPPLAADSAARAARQRYRLLDFQSRAQRVGHLLGLDVAAPMQNETLRGYAMRVAMIPWKRYDSTWKDIDVEKLPKEAFAVAVDSVLKAAEAEGRDPKFLPVGQLRSFQHRTDTGHLVTEFKGGKGAAASWLNPPSRRRYVTAINIRGSMTTPSMHAPGYSPAV
jgi:hypothetical protein